MVMSFAKLSNKYDKSEQKLQGSLAADLVLKSILQYMIMGGQQPPILINQTSMASTMLGNQAMMPSYITIGTPLDVRQNVSQAM